MRPPRLPIVIALAAGTSAAPVLAQPLTAGAACGGDAFSSAQVIEHRPPRRGPLTAMPDTLCADLSPQHPPAEVRIDAYPVLLPQVGRGRDGIPYEGGSTRPARP